MNKLVLSGVLVALVLGSVACGNDWIIPAGPKTVSPCSCKLRKPDAGVSIPVVDAGTTAAADNDAGQDAGTIVIEVVDAGVTVVDAGTIDAGTVVDAGTVPEPDGGTCTGEEDAGTPDAGSGGSCNVIRLLCTDKVMDRCEHNNRGDYEGKAWWKACCVCASPVKNGGKH